MRADAPLEIGDDARVEGGLVEPEGDVDDDPFDGADPLVEVGGAVDDGPVAAATALAGDTAAGAEVDERAGDIQRIADELGCEPDWAHDTVVRRLQAESVDRLVDLEGPVTVGDYVANNLMQVIVLTMQGAEADPPGRQTPSRVWRARGRRGKRGLFVSVKAVGSVAWALLAVLVAASCVSQTSDNQR